MNNQNTTLLIAGIFSVNSLKMIDLYINIFQYIVISTYEDSKNKYLDEFKHKYLDTSNITLIENKLPSADNLHNSQNIYMQCFSTIQGLLQLRTRNVIKMRSDEFYSSFDILLEVLPSNKISTCNVFVRDVSYKYLHLSDHVIVGEVSLILNSFQNLIYYIELNSSNKDPLGILANYIPAETKIFLFMLFELEEKCLLNWNEISEEEMYELMNKYFYLFDIDIYSPLLIKSSVVGEIKNYKKFIKNDTKLYLRHITSIENLKPRNILNKFVDRLLYKIKRVTCEE